MLEFVIFENLPNIKNVDISGSIKHEENTPLPPPPCSSFYFLIKKSDSINIA